MAGGGCAALEGTARALALDSPRPGTPTHNELSAVRVVVLKQILSFQPRSYGQPLGLRFPGFRGYVVLSWVKGRGQGGQARRLVLGERHLGRLKHNCACAAPRPALCADLYPEEVRLRVSWRPAMGFSKKFRFLSPSSAPTWPAHSDLRMRSYFLAFRVSVHDFCRRPTTRSYCLSFLSSILLYSCNRAYSVKLSCVRWDWQRREMRLVVETCFNVCPSNLCDLGEVT